MKFTILKYPILFIIGLILAPGYALAQRDTDGLASPKTTVVHHKAKEKKVDCNLGRSYNKNICSNIEDNKAYLIKYQLQSKSGKNSSDKIKEWAQTYYECIKCKEEPGFSGGTMLRKVVFENSLSVAFLLVYEMKVDMNFVEEDGYTLLDWLQSETEKTFDEAFDTEDEEDKKWLLKSLNNKLKYYNLFRNNGAFFTHELIAQRGQELREQEKAEEPNE